MKRYWKNLSPACLLLILQVLGTELVNGQVTKEATNQVNDIASQNQQNQDSVKRKADSRNFVLQVLSAGNKEIEASKTALEKCKDQAVKDFASTIVRDHTAANQELKSIAQSKGIQLPQGLTDEPGRNKSSMNNAGGESDYDEHYIRMMIEGHKKAIDLFKEGSNLSDPELKAFATKQLAVIQQHYDRITEISKQSNVKKLSDDKPKTTPPAPEGDKN